MNGPVTVRIFRADSSQNVLLGHFDFGSDNFRLESSSFLVNGAAELDVGEELFLGP